MDLLPVYAVLTYYIKEYLWTVGRQEQYELLI